MNVLLRIGGKRCDYITKLIIASHDVEFSLKCQKEYSNYISNNEEKYCFQHNDFLFWEIKNRGSSFTFIWLDNPFQNDKVNTR